MNIKDLLQIGQEAATTFGASNKVGGALGLTQKVTEAYSAYREIMSAPNKIDAAMAYAQKRTGKKPEEIAAIAKGMQGKQREFAERHFPGALDSISRLGGGTQQALPGNSPDNQSMPREIADLLARAKK